jgi:uncharacterized membrane protein YesL
VMLYFIFSTFPTVLVLFGGSITSFMIMWVSRSTLFQIKNKYPSEETV